jgi:23S rRNA (adenine2030-N6)-methyltransferase
MNYRHAYHAGNHADVLKHIILVRILEYLRQKEKPFAVLDAHAGIGRYDLKGAEAFKTGEWKDGIGKMLARPLPDAVKPVLSLYLNMIHDLNPDGMLRHYPGSPEIAAWLLRRSDRMLFNELHPQDADMLAARYSADTRVRVTRLDAATSVKAELPFPEKRGLVLLDPAFEVADELLRVLRMLRHILQRMKNATVMVWYPLKAPDQAHAFKAELAALGEPGTLCAELLVRQGFAEGGLAGSGVVVVNPPYTLRAELELLLPILAERLGVGSWGKGSVSEITPPK